MPRARRSGAGRKSGAVKVLDDSARGLLSEWIAGLDWIAANLPDVQATNMSVESDAQYGAYCDDADAYTRAFAQGLEVLRACGTLTFWELRAAQWKSGVSGAGVCLSSTLILPSD